MRYKNLKYTVRVIKISDDFHRLILSQLLSTCFSAIKIVNFVKLLTCLLSICTYMDFPNLDSPYRLS